VGGISLVRVKPGEFGVPAWEICRELVLIKRAPFGEKDRFVLESLSLGKDAHESI
jgi:hypothetical protein